MRTTATVGLTLASILGICSSASAQTWQGAYIGLHVGGASAEADITNSANPDGTLEAGLFTPAIETGHIPEHTSPDASGFAGGFNVGFNWEMPAWVFGIEADASWIDLSASETVDVPAFDAYPAISTTQDFETSWLVTLRARAGMLAAPNWLIYGTAGLAGGDVEGSTTITPDTCAGNAFCSAGADSETLWGWTIGGGVEHKLGSGWTFRAEYLYYDLGELTYTAVEISPGFPLLAGEPNVDVETEVTGQILRVGVNFPL